jgi:hypothetical protein
MSKFMQILSAVLAFEEQFVPIFVHNAKSQTIAAVVMAGESVAAEVAQQIVAASTPQSAVAPVVPN